MRKTYLSDSQIENIRKLVSVSESYLKQDDRINEADRNELLEAGKALKSLFALCGNSFVSVKNAL